MRIILVCALPGILNVPAFAESSMEEIYIARSVREATNPPTEFCAKAKNVEHANSEDRRPVYIGR